MGGLESVLSKDEIQILCRSSKFSLKELKRIHKRFVLLDREGKGWTSVDDILQIPEFKDQPLSDRMARLMTDDMGEVINFKVFVETLAVFSDKADAEEKCRYFFRLYDMDGDGYVGPSELFLAFRAIGSGSLSNEQIESIIRPVISQADRDKDGLLSYNEFKRILNG